VSLTLLFGLMTLAPAVVAIVLGIFSRITAFRLPPLIALVLAGLAIAAPIIGLILLTSDLAFPTPLRFAFAGDSATPFAPVFRADGLSFYGAWGIAAIIAPLLLWLVWMDAGRSADASGRLLAELALVIGLEVCALHLVFADNLLWLGLVWLALVALAWFLGEQGAETTDLDYRGLIAMLIGPALTVLILMLIAVTTKDHTLYALTGHSAASPLQIILLAVALTLAGGGYPFVAWVRRRAAFATPSGFGVLLVLALPVVVFVGARAWGALQANTSGLWPQIGAVTPPITGGIALAVLGALTVAIGGLLALGRRDGRTLVALLATAQVGWGLFALGSSQPAAAIGILVLLATGVVGVGAMTASLVAGGMLTADDEPDGAGPAPFGLATRPLNLVVWCVGAATAIGVPFFGGFVARHLITAGTLAGTKLGIPLLGLAWLGDALFALALIRATVLAFKYDPDELAEDESDTEKRTPSRDSELLELPGAALAVIGVALGIFPQTFLNMGVLFATDQMTPEGAANGVLRIVPFGYSTGNSQWLPGIFWLAAVLLTVVILLVRLGTRRSAVTLETSEADQLTGMESDALDEPAVVWVDLASAFTSPWTQIAGNQLIGGIDEDDGYSDAQLDEDEEESDDSDGGSGLDDTIPPDDDDDASATPDDGTPADDVLAAEDMTEDVTEEQADEAPAQQTPVSERRSAKQGSRKAGQRGQTQQ
jgi:formate hydrogenlyase subunit 3/multisubunit Na+/H+ antiporter MnhD subunit